MILFIIALVYLLIFLRYEGITGQHSTPISWIAMSIILTSAAFLVLVAFSYHVKYVEVVRKSRVGSLRFSAIGLLAAAVPTIYDLFFLTDYFLIALMGLLSALLFFLGRGFFEKLVAIAPLKDVDIKGLFPTYPPRERLDLMRLDGVIVLVLAMPFLALLLH